MKQLLLIPLLALLTGCLGGSSSSPTPPPPDPPPVTTTIKGVFRKVKSATTQAAPLAQASAMQASSSSPTMVVPRIYHSGKRLIDGRLLIAGGMDKVSGGAVHASAEIFDPGSESFSSAGTMGVGRVSPAMVRLTNGKMVVIGGIPYDLVAANTVDVYDPTTGTWTSRLTTKIQNKTGMEQAGQAFALSNNRFVYYGGLPSGGGVQHPVLVDTNYEPWVEAFLTTDAVHQRYGLSLSELRDGRVVLAGGFNYSHTAVDTVVIMDTQEERLYFGASLLTARGSHSSYVYDDNTVEFYGGYTGSTHLKSVERLGIGIVGNLQDARAHLQTNLLQNGITLHGGGSDALGHPTDVQLTWNHSTNVGLITNQMVKARTHFLSLPLANGRVLYAGGSVDRFGTVDNTAEIFDSYNMVMMSAEKDQVLLGQTVQFTLVEGAAVTWTCDVGTIDANGLYTAPADEVDPLKPSPATAVITATNSQGKAAFRLILIDPTPVPVD